MTKQSLTKKLVAISCVAVSALTMTASAFAAIPEAEAPISQEVVIMSADDGMIVPYAYEYEWRYKTMSDGYVYKRLWNATLARWETEWEKVS